ncbi:vanadium-dependent haloperoxidase [Edaphobacter aggregans]|uniref:vanadium-dependent haloperoxidase n=1 Tax=Edaphobacter aggregans TaxID=570835 RepID=UPI000691ED3E
MRDHHSVDDDAKLFFVLSAALHDAAIASWDAKRAWDSVRPITAIPELFHGQQIQSWGGPARGTVSMDGGEWIPYQSATFPTPPFPSYVSGHSTFSAAGATVLSAWTGSDKFGASVTFEAGSSVIESGMTPASTLVLSWDTFSDAANEAGMSRRYGGIHFKADDLTGRDIGRKIGMQAWRKSLTYFNGTAGTRDNESSESR